jgi:isopenicillin-N N-acyltransferase-like protein
LEYASAKCGLRLVKIEGKPYEMGVQRGKKVGDLIRKRLEIYRRSGREAEVVELCERCEQAIQEKFPEIIEEFRGIADGSGVSYNELRNFAFQDSAYKYETGSAVECSSFAATKEATADGHPIITKNADLAPRMSADDTVIVYAKPHGRNRYIAVSAWPEWVAGPDGMNEKGLALAGSGVNPIDADEALSQDSRIGIPLYFLQSVIYSNCGDVNEAVEYLKLTPKGCGYGRNLNLVDMKGNLLKAEVSYGKVNFLWPYQSASHPTNGFFAGTGHFCSKDMNKLGPSPEKYSGSYRRFDRLMSLLSRSAGSIDFDLARAIMKDHSNGPSDASICRHSSVTNTLGSMVMQPAYLRTWILKGRPCENSYEPFDL